ncbi:MAG: FAD-dependent oxidoreductase [Deltaproteobacteria bacterium]|nr:FAD-dependent oxidoreductase [Deltaproteobacteria bacterium]
MKKEKFPIEIPDIAYWKKQIKCQDACPVYTDARGYVRAIADGDFEKAYLIARGPNPLASICGRICGASCEAACRRADFDEAISIRALKRFVTEKFGVESGRYDKSPLQVIRRFLSMTEDECEDFEDIKNLLKHFQSPTLSDTSPTVGIIGSGPTGLAAAHDLCLLGIKPVIYEMEPVPAGMLYLGVPEYRLPRRLIEAEVEVIKALGTDIVCNVQVGKDITMTQLRARHDAVLIAVGAKKSKKIPIPNIDAPGVIGGVDFLKDVALDREVALGEKVVVIGGGNVAYDVARTLVRQTEYDVSRTAIRQKGVKEVHLVCLESLTEMPADTEEIEDGAAEGITRYNSWGPKEILVDDHGRACGVSFVRCLSIFDENRRFAPQYDDTTVMSLDADKVFLSIGQDTDLSFIDSADIALNERGQLKLDSAGSMTEAEGVFAAGDVAYGAKLMIHAIASGKQVARRIYTYLNRKEISFTTTLVHSEIKGYSRECGYEEIPREGVPVMPPEERKKAMNLMVEKGFTEDQGRRQASRCLNCSVNTIFDSEKCILCGGCADICPEYCLKLVPVEALQGSADYEKLLQNYPGDLLPSDAGAIIKDETICIRCGLCAERCPVGAITMEAFNFKEVWGDE